jgi:hypothetical protein
MIRTFVIILGVIILIIVIKFLWNTSEIFSNYSNNVKLDSVTKSQTAPDEYLKLFKNRNKLVLDESKESRRRNTISEFYYNKNFLVQVYKIDTVNDLSVKKIVNESFSPSSMSIGNEYSQDLNNAEFEIGYREGPKERISNIFFTLFGDSTGIIEKNDSLAYYYSKFENFSIRYGINSPKDIYANIKEDFKNHKAPLELMFLKRNRNLYVILLGAVNEQIPTPRDMLYNLIIAK